MIEDADMGLYVQIDTSIRRSDAIDHGRRSLGVDTATLVGAVALLFAELLEARRGGIIADLSDAWIEEAAAWRGKAGDFAAYIRDAWTDEQGRITDWLDRYGAIEAKRLHDRDRKRAERGRAPALGVRGPDPDGPASVRGPSSDSPGISTGKNGQQESRENSSTASSTARELLIRAARNPGAARASIEAMASGMHGRPVAEAALELAASDMLANGEPFTAQRFRYYAMTATRTLAEAAAVERAAAAPGDPGPRQGSRSGAGGEGRLRPSLRESAAVASWDAVLGAILGTPGGWRYFDPRQLPEAERRALSKAGGAKAVANADEIGLRVMAKAYRAAWLEAVEVVEPTTETQEEQA